MLHRCVGGALGLLLMAAAACAPASMGASAGARPATMSAAVGGGAGRGVTAAGAGASLAAPGGGAGTPSDPGLVIKPAPTVAGSPARDDSDAGKADDCGAIRQMADAKPSPVDIVWVIDNSGSMADEQAAIQKNIASFAAAIGGAGIDHHVLMVTKDDVAAGTPLGTDTLHYRHVPVSIGSHDALSKLLDSYSQYADFLRPTAALHFVIVSDDESQMKATDFKAQMEALAGKTFIAHAIVSESVSGHACVGACGISLLCGAASPGLEYLALAGATGGQKISICVSDWSTVFEPLKTAVIASAPLPCEYALPAAPAGSAFDPGRVNVDVLLGSSAKTLPRASSSDACASAQAWFYDDPKKPTVIRMCPAACSSISGGGSIEISLGCETVSLN